MAAADVGLGLDHAGVMKSTSSVRLFLSSCWPKSPPKIGMRDSSGMPSDAFVRPSAMRPPMTIVWPLGTAT